MQQIGKRTVYAALMVMVCIGGITMIGCDKLESETRQKDKAVEEMVRQSGQLRGGDVSKAQLDQLKKATELAISLATKANTNALVGQRLLRDGKTLLIGPRMVKTDKSVLPETIQSREIAAQQMIWNLGGLVRQLQLLNATATALKQNGPKDARDAKNNWTDGWATIDAQKTAMAEEIKGIKAKIEETQGVINAKDAEIAGLDKQREKAASDGDALAKQSDAAKGQQSVDLYEQATKQREQASELSVQIEAAKTALDVQKAELKNLQDLLKSREGTLKLLDSQRQTLDTAWASLQKQVESLNAAAKKMAEETIVPKAQELDNYVRETDVLRDQALGKLEEAAKTYAVSAGLARQMGMEMDRLLNDPKLAKAPEQAAWRRQKRIVNENSFKLQEGNAQYMQGIITLGRKTELAARKRLADDLAAAVKDSGNTVTAPAAPADVDKLMTEASKATFDYLQKAQETLQSVAQTALETPEEKAAGAAYRTFVLYAEYLNNKDDGKLEEAGKKFEEAKSELAKITGEGGLALPFLPKDLAGERKMMTLPNLAAAGGGGTPTSPAEAGGDAGDAARAAKDFADALAKNDVDAAKALTSQLPAAQEQMLSPLAAYAQALAGLKDAAKQKWADQGAAIDKLPDVVADLKAAAKVEGDTATIASRLNPQQPFTLKKVEKAWKVTVLGLPSNADTVLAAVAKQMTDVADEIKNNTHASFDAAMAELVKKLKGAGVEFNLGVEGAAPAAPATAPAGDGSTPAPATPATAPAGDGSTPAPATPAAPAGDGGMPATPATPAAPADGAAPATPAPAPEKNN